MNFDQTHTQTHTNTHTFNTPSAPTFTHEHAASTHRHTNMHLQKTDSKMHLQDTCHHGHTTRTCASRQTHHHTRTTQHLPSHRSSAATILKNSEPFQHEPESMAHVKGVVSLQSLLTSPAPLHEQSLPFRWPTLGFEHLHLDVTMSRVIIFRVAILDLFSEELGAIIFVKTHFSGRR